MDSKKSLRLLNDNVLLIQQTQEKTVSGIIIPPSTQKQEIKIICYISAVGPDVKNKDLKEGTFVIIPRHTGKWVEFDGFKYVLVKESDILCIIDGVEMEERK